MTRRLLSLLLLACVPLAVRAQGSANFIILAGVVDNGGLGAGSPRSASYLSTASVGQAASQTMSTGADGSMLLSGFGCVFCTMEVLAGYGDAPHASDFALGQNYPNPFAGVTRIAFTLDGREAVTLGVYNLLGEEVAHLADGVYDAGAHEIGWTPVDVPPGTYYYRLRIGARVRTKMMVLVR